MHKHLSMCGEQIDIYWCRGGNDHHNLCKQIDRVWLKLLTSQIGVEYVIHYSVSVQVLTQQKHRTLVGLTLLSLGTKVEMGCG